MSGRARTRDPAAPAAPIAGAEPAPRPPVPSGLPEIPDPRSLAPDARALSTALFQRLSSLEEGTPEYAYVRNTLVELNLTLVKYAASRFAHRTQSMEDILQVGTIGLIKAINRFDVTREVEFASFALPTICGEIKRFFRDSGWAVRVPRRLQELRIDIARATDALEQQLGRAPTTAELADHLNVDEADVLEGRRAANGYSTRSLDATFDDDPARDPAPAQRYLGEEDRAFETVEYLVSLKPLVAALSERDRMILLLRFGEELTQKEIGARLGVSQMHVSRLLTRITTALREALLADSPPAIAVESAADRVTADRAATPSPPTPSSRAPEIRTPTPGRATSGPSGRGHRVQPHRPVGAWAAQGCHL